MSDSRKLALTLVFKGIDGVTGTLKSIMGASDGAAGKLRKLTQEAKGQKAELAALKAKIKETGDADGALARQQADLEQQMARTTHKIELQRAAVARLAKWQERGQRATEAGQKNLAIGTTMAVPLVLAVKQAMDFQDHMTETAQKADLTAAETEKLKGNIIAIARATKQLPTSIQAGTDFLAGAGMDPRQAIQMMGAVGKTATATGAQIEDLSKSSYAVYDNLKVPLNQIQYALDAMHKAGKDGNFELVDMARYFPQITAQAQALGQTGVSAVADLAAALEIARKGAGDAEGAATNLADLLAQINTARTRKAFKAYRVDLVKEMALAAKQGKTPLEAIALLTQKALGGDLKSIPLLFRNQQAAGAVRSLIQHMDEYRRIRRDAFAAAGTVDHDFGIRAHNAAVQWRELTGDLQILAIKVGDQLLPPLVRLAQKIDTISTRVFAWTDKHKALTSVLVQGAAALALTELGLGALRIGFGAVVGPAVKAYNALKWLKGVGVMVGFVEETAPLLSGALIGLGTAMDTFGAMAAAAAAPLLANPITWVVLAIVAVLAVAVPFIIRHWRAITAGFSAAFAVIAEALRPLGDAIGRVVAWFGGLWSKIKGPLFAGVKLIAAAFLNLTPLGWIIQAFAPVFRWFQHVDWGSLGRNLMMGIINGILFMMGPLGAVVKKAALAGIEAYNKTDTAQYGAKAATIPLPQLAPAAARGHTTIGGHTIIVNAPPGAHPQAIAQEVGRQLDARDRAAAARARAAYKDGAS
jgi:TP901 family phage tail tape measure protein